MPDRDDLNVERNQDNPERVGCDEHCGALENPVTLEDYRLALEHWMYHRHMYGCSHA